MSVKALMMKWMFGMIRLPSCVEVDQFAYDFLEGKLDQKTMRAVKRHLWFCKNCKKFIASYHMVAQQAKVAPPPPLDAEFRERIFTFLQKK